MEYEAFLLGYAFSGLEQVQSYLLKSDHSGALSHISEVMRYLKEHLNKPTVENKVESKW